MAAVPPTALHHRVRDYVWAGEPQRAAEALCAVLTEADTADTATLIRVARLYESAGELQVAREWLDRVRWRTPDHPEWAIHYARVAGRLHDKEGIEAVEQVAPADAARAWCAMGLPDRGLSLLEARLYNEPHLVPVWAEVAAAGADEARVLRALQLEWNRARAAWDPRAMFLAGASLEGLRTHLRPVPCHLHALRANVVTHPARGMTARELMTLGLPRTLSRTPVSLPAGSPSARTAALSVATLLGRSLVADGWWTGGSAEIRCQLVLQALSAQVERDMALRVGLLAAVDPSPIVRAFPADRLWLAALSIDPHHRALQRGLGLGVRVCS